MGYTTSTVHGIEVPDSSEANNVPEDIGKVVTALEGGSIIRRLTGAQISALTAPQKPAGLVVYNTTTSKVQVSSGSYFVDIDADPYFLHAIRSADRTFTAGETWDVQSYGTSIASSLMSWNSTTGVLSIQTTGVYQVNAYAANSGAFLEPILYPSAEPPVQGSTQVTVGGVGARSVAWTYYLESGSTLKLQIKNTSGSSQTMTDAVLTVALIGRA